MSGLSNFLDKRFGLYRSLISKAAPGSSPVYGRGTMVLLPIMAVLGAAWPVQYWWLRSGTHKIAPTGL